MCNSLFRAFLVIAVRWFSHMATFPLFIIVCLIIKQALAQPIPLADLSADLSAALITNFRGQNICNAYS